MLAIEIGNKSIVIDQIAYITQQTDTDSTSYTLVLVDGTSFNITQSQYDTIKTYLTSD